MSKACAWDHSSESHLKEQINAQQIGYVLGLKMNVNSKAFSLLSITITWLRNSVAGRVLEVKVKSVAQLLKWDPPCKMTSWLEYATEGEISSQDTKPGSNSGVSIRL